MVEKSLNVLYFVLLACYFIDASSTLSIAITPEILKEGGDGSVNISCTVDDKEADAKTVFMLAIERQGEKPIVSLQATTGLQFNSGVYNSDKFQAEGRIAANDGGQSFLKLSILHPTYQDQGTYTCKIIYTADVGLVEEHHADKNLTIDTITCSDLRDAVSSLLDKVAQLERTIQTQSVKVTKVEHAATTLDGRTLQLEKTAQTLENRTQKQVEQMDRLTDRVTFSSAFSATMNQQTNVHIGEVFPFNHVMMRHGQGYNETAAVYTAPRPGLYVFHLVLRSSGLCCYATVHLKVNDDVAASLHIEVPREKQDDQSAISSIVDLKTGDEVKVVSANRIDWDADMFSVFSGYNIRTV